MATIITDPSRIEAAGTKSKTILEYTGRVRTQSEGISIAHMRSPTGWREPGQRPQFDEYTLVLKGNLRAELDGREPLVIKAMQMLHVAPGEWVRYSTPALQGAEYVAICVPAFSPDSVHRDPE